MARLKLPTTLGMSKILEACLVREVDVLAVESCPRMFGFSTGLYTDYGGRLIGTLVMDTKLCCALAAGLKGLGEEEGQDLVLLREFPEELQDQLEQLFDVLTSAFFLDDGSDRLRCKLYRVCSSPGDIPKAAKAFMATPPIHQAYQVSLRGYGEGTLLYIGSKDVTMEERVDGR